MQPHIGDLLKYYQDTFLSKVIIPCGLSDFSLNVENNVEQTYMMGGHTRSFEIGPPNINLSLKLIFSGTGIDYNKILYATALVPTLHDKVFVMNSFNIDQDTSNTVANINYFINLSE